MLRNAPCLRLQRLSLKSMHPEKDPIPQMRQSVSNYDPPTIFSFREKRELSKLTKQVRWSLQNALLRPSPNAQASRKREVAVAGSGEWVPGGVRPS
ncbi:hypothetical protein VUR80DRAFT_3003 [Thermomyces stellatus]